MATLNEAKQKLNAYRTDWHGRSDRGAGAAERDQFLAGLKNSLDALSEEPDVPDKMTILQLANDIAAKKWGFSDEPGARSAGPKGSLLQTLTDIQAILEDVAGRKRSLPDVILDKMGHVETALGLINKKIFNLYSGEGEAEDKLDPAGSFLEIAWGKYLKLCASPRHYDPATVDSEPFLPAGESHEAHWVWLSKTAVEAGKMWNTAKFAYNVVSAVSQGKKEGGIVGMVMAGKTALGAKTEKTSYESAFKELGSRIAYWIGLAFLRTTFNYLLRMKYLAVSLKDLAQRVKASGTLSDAEAQVLERYNTELVALLGAYLKYAPAILEQDGYKELGYTQWTGRSPVKLRDIALELKKRLINDAASQIQAKTAQADSWILNRVLRKKLDLVPRGNILAAALDIGQIRQEDFVAALESKSEQVDLGVLDEIDFNVLEHDQGIPGAAFAARVRDYVSFVTDQLGKARGMLADDGSQSSLKCALRSHLLMLRASGVNYRVLYGVDSGAADTAAIADAALALGVTPEGRQRGRGMAAHGGRGRGAAVVTAPANGESKHPRIAQQPLNRTASLPKSQPVAVADDGMDNKHNR
jgi:hypothetical protein